ncbi:hypothetical protein VAWG002_21340 [Aeromonas veronii]|nr:hypothetical protein VAWG002_21340 [Aeromonas veronii]
MFGGQHIGGLLKKLIIGPFDQLIRGTLFHEITPDTSRFVTVTIIGCGGQTSAPGVAGLSKLPPGEYG